MVLMKNKLEFVSCDSGLGCSIGTNEIISTYEYDIQELPLTLCNVNMGLEDRLESINESFNEFSKKLDSIELRCKTCDDKLGDIKIALHKFEEKLLSIPRHRKGCHIQRRLR